MLHYTYIKVISLLGILDIYWLYKGTLYSIYRCMSLVYNALETMLYNEKGKIDRVEKCLMIGLICTWNIFQFLLVGRSRYS